MADLTRPQLALCVAGARCSPWSSVCGSSGGGRERAGGGAPRPAATIAVHGRRGRRPAWSCTSRARSGARASTGCRAGARVDDAVARAGGATRRADLGGLNLAAKVEDGRQSSCRQRAPRRPAPRRSSDSAAAPAAGPAAQPQHGDARAARHADGVGPATAQKILDFREEHGGFGSVEELGEVPGIGEKRLAALREEVTL